MKIPCLIITTVFLLSSLVACSPTVPVSSDGSNESSIACQQDDQYLNITAFDGLITSGTDCIKISQHTNTTPANSLLKSVSQSASRAVSIPAGSETIAQKLANNMTTTTPAVSKILSSCKHLAATPANIMSSALSTIHNLEDILNNNQTGLLHGGSNYTSIVSQKDNSMVDSVVPNGADIIYIINALEAPNETVSFGEDVS